MAQNVFDHLIAQNEKSQRATIKQVLQQSCMFDVGAKKIDGRKIMVADDKWVVDFASCNYLGFDLDDEIMAAIEPAVHKWGTHPSWARIVASPHIYHQCEEELARLVGSEDFLLLPTVTLVHLGVIPALVGKDGVLFLDKTGHMTMYEASKVARDSGATLCSFAYRDYSYLEELLHQHRSNPKKVILIDGTYSMSGDYADLPQLVRLAREYNALLYVDDAHGFGVIGERPTEEMPYGYRGNGLAKHCGLDYDRDHIFYVAGFSKAYSSLAAGMACNARFKQFLKAYASPYDLSGPSPTASLATLLAGLQVNAERGDAYRAKLYRISCLAVDTLRTMGFEVRNTTYFPIITIWIGDTETLIAISEILFEYGVLVTLGPYPMVPKGHEVLRITITAANTEEEIQDYLIPGFHAARNYLEKQNHPCLKHIHTEERLS